MTRQHFNGGLSKVYISLMRDNLREKQESWRIEYAFNEGAKWMLSIVNKCESCGSAHCTKNGGQSTICKWTMKDGILS